MSSFHLNLLNMQFTNFNPFNEDLIQVVIETPKGSQHKYAFDVDLQIFRLKKTLPIGSVFPFDFGFIPNTAGGDGDPLDVLVMNDEPSCLGCLVECRVLGVLMAKQKEKNGKTVRNDRIIAVSACSILFANIKKIKHLNDDMSTQIQNFFIDYNKQLGKKFIPLKFTGASYAHELIRNAVNENMHKA